MFKVIVINIYCNQFVLMAIIETIKRIQNEGFFGQPLGQNSNGQNFIYYNEEEGKTQATGY